MLHRNIAHMNEPLIHTTLLNGTPVDLRPLHATDRDKLRETIAAFSPHSRYLRFFCGFENPPEAVIRRLSDVDGYDHIAWGAFDPPGGEVRIIGAVHAIRTRTPCEAEFALGVLDAFHAQGVARLIIAALVQDCLAQGLTKLRAEVLSENSKAIGLFRSLGARAIERSGPVITFAFELSEMDKRLRDMTMVPGLNAVYDGLNARKAA